MLKAKETQYIELERGEEGCRAHVSTLLQSFKIVLYKKERA